MIFLLLFLLFAFWLILRSGKREARKAAVKGEYGENQIADILEQYQKKRKKESMRVLRNLYIPIGKETTEIDLVMIHEKGILVFESKYYGGWIYGTRKNEYWTQKFPNGKSYQFYNPMKQNQTHIKALAEYLNLPPDDFDSYIVFSDECELKRVPKNGEKVKIIRQFQLSRNLWDRLDGGESNKKLNRREVKAIAEKLTPLTRVSAKVKQRHIAYVRDLQKDLRKKR